MTTHRADMTAHRADMTALCADIITAHHADMTAHRADMTAHCADMTADRDDMTAPGRRQPNAGGMLNQRRRRWSNITLALGERLVFAGVGPDGHSAVASVVALLWKPKEQ